MMRVRLSHRSQHGYPDTRRVTMHRFGVSLSVTLMLLCGLSALGGPARVSAQDATPAAGAAARTDVRYVVPFGPDGLNPGLTATTTEAGDCGFPSSAALDRPDAWDCTGEEGQIYDPCFENPFLAPDEPGQVACFASPFSSEVVVLTLTTPLERQKEAPEAGVGMVQAAGVSLDPWDLPWAVELANGDRCTLLGGTLTVLAGQTAHYGCEQGGTILGEVQHQNARWTVSYLAEGEIASRLVEVVAAWS
jgi:hypothetical protein